ncbi:MAG TPA: hypothetical protein VND21_07840, partial [Planctomycetota bacterium]|nr:hypothetical protein [Planctomycetota bacterium]
VETYRPMIDETMVQVSKSIPDAGSESGGPGQVTGLESMKPMLEGLTGAMKTFLDSAERLDLGLRLDGGKASFDLRFLAKTGSALDRPKSARGDVAALAASLPADYPVVVLLGGGLREMTEWSMKFSDMTFAAMPEAQRTAFKGLMSRSKEMTDLLGDEMAVAFRMGDAGFEMVEILSAKDPKAYLAKMDEMFRGQGDTLAAMGVTVETLPPSTTAGVDVREWSMAFDFDKLAAMNAETTGQDPAKSEAARKAMQAMFGSGKLRARSAAVGNRVVIAMGGADDLMGKALAAVKAPGKPSATLASALSAAGARPTFVVSLEMRELVGGVLNLMGKVMPASADKPPPTMPAGGPVHVMAYGTMEGREYAGTFSADVAAAAQLIKGLVEQMKPAAVEVPPPDDK